MRIDRNTFEVKKIGDGAAANEPGFPQKPDFSDSLLLAGSSVQVYTYKFS